MQTGPASRGPSCTSRDWTFLVPCCHLPDLPARPWRSVNRPARGGQTAMAFELPPLPYAYDALTPSIDEETMHLHHDKHHAAYVNNLNTATEGTPFADMSIDELVRNLNMVPDDKRTAVRNNGGGHYNHSMFWEIMRPGGGEIGRAH